MSAKLKNSHPSVGTVIGKYVVIESGIKNNGRYCARVRCECGRENIVKEHHLLRPSTAGCKRCSQKTDPLEVRFWSKVAIGSPGECWEWKAARLKSGGYGAFMIDGVTHRANRVAWELSNGQRLPTGMFACHRCDNPPCCNPLHLFAGTPKDNTDDKDRKQRGRNQCGPWMRKMPIA